VGGTNVSLPTDPILIDEDLSHTLADIAQNEFGREAYAVVHIGPSGAKDWQLFARLQERGHILVTHNRIDWLKLMARAELHAGLIVFLGNGRRAQQQAWFRAAMRRLQEIGSLVNKVIEVDETGAVVVHDLP
jgi:predicted nuclease of predicted toxin-antitoxin system